MGLPLSCARRSMNWKMGPRWIWAALSHAMSARTGQSFGSSAYGKAISEPFPCWSPLEAWHSYNSLLNSNYKTRCYTCTKKQGIIPGQPFIILPYLTSKGLLPVLLSRLRLSSYIAILWLIFINLAPQRQYSPMQKARLPGLLICSCAPSPSLARTP